MKETDSDPAPAPAHALAASGSPDPSEIARFLREQPPIVVPRRSFETGRQPPGLVAHRLLGNRVITRYET